MPDDPWRERFLPTPFMSEMLSRGWLGEKSGQGFYKRVGPQKEIYALDWNTFEYRTALKPKPPAAVEIGELPARLKALAVNFKRYVTHVADSLAAAQPARETCAC